MIVSLHVATGAAAGAALRSRAGAVAAGLLLHLLGDRVPHRDIASRGFELWSGAVPLTLLAAVRGPTGSPGGTVRAASRCGRSSSRRDS